LGRADDATIASIVTWLGGRRPVSAAMGEWTGESIDVPAGLDFAKWGLAGWLGRDWQGPLSPLVGGGSPRVVVAAYADWQRAQAPPVEEVVAFACAHAGVFLVDTFDKTSARGTSKSLLDWLSVDEIVGLCRRLSRSGVRVALAGSLGADELAILRPAAPDWFAVRGAVCAGSRTGSVCTQRVKDLVSVLKSPEAASPAS
jgi:hypothetical protein